MRKNRKCICCSTQYCYCPDCGGVDRLKPSWYSEFCGEDCKDLWMAATRFNMKTISKEEAKKIILALNLKDKAEYVECVQKDLDNIVFEDLEHTSDETTAVVKSATHEVVTKGNK